MSMEDKDKPSVEEAALEDELYGDQNTAPNTLTQPSIGVQAAIVARLLANQEE